MPRFIFLLISIVFLFSSVGRADPLQATNLLTVYICPIQRADAMLLTYKNYSMLIDTGEAADYNAVDQMINYARVDRIDYVVNTHPHHDHLGSLPQLINNYEIGEFYTCFPEDFSSPGVVQQEAISALQAANIPVHSIDDGDQLLLGDVTLTVYRQKETKSPKPAVSVNSHSMMLMVKYGICRMLLTADVTVGAQNIFVRNGYDLSADVMKLPHHGRERMSAKFFKAVDPDYVFITNNKSDSKNARKQLNSYRLKPLLTSNGLIRYQTDGVYWTAEQF